MAVVGEMKTHGIKQIQLKNIMLLAYNYFEYNAVFNWLSK